MKEIFIELLKSVVLAIIPVFGTLAVYFGNKVKKYYEEKIKSETVDKVLKTTVEYVEQVFIDIKGKEKLDKAIEVALSRLQAKGIDIDEVELTILIEAFVRGLK